MKCERCDRAGQRGNQIREYQVKLPWSVGREMLCWKCVEKLQRRKAYTVTDMVYIKPRDDW